MKKVSKKVSGKAYLLGDEKTTLNLINGILLMIPDENKDNAKSILEKRLVVDFSEEHEIDEPEDLDEAVDMLPNGRESMTKMAITKAITNQMDKIRADIVKRIVKEADVPAIIAKVAQGK